MVRMFELLRECVVDAFRYRQLCFVAWDHLESLCGACRPLLCIEDGIREQTFCV
jgi:hypothetical protein